MTEANTDEGREIARLAMEGEERTQKRERETKIKSIKTEREQISERLRAVLADKEKLELAWVELDNARKLIRKNLEPILAEEKSFETEESALEDEEAKIGLAKDKQVVEKKRWLAQDKRRAAEEKKWQEEDKLAKLDQTIEANTTNYRSLLDEEEKLETRLTELGAEEAAL